jgi:lauroyl/myristoyl acyltransferase
MAGGELSRGDSARPSASDEDSASLLDRAVAAAVGLLLAVLRALPTGLALGLGAFAGRWIARLGGPRTGDARINLRIAFPEWDEARRARVL